jgi:uncharacterized membrane protein YqjE
MTHAPMNEQELEDWSTAQLVKEIAAESKELVMREVQLAQAELKADLKHELSAAEGLGVAALFGVGTFCSLLTTAIFALALVLPGWAAGLIVTGASALIAAIVGTWGWARRTKTPLSRTRHTLVEDLQWAKNRLA